MATVSKMTVNGYDYDIRDSNAQGRITALENEQNNGNSILYSTINGTNGLLDNYQAKQYIITDAGAWGSPTSEHICIPVHAGDSVKIFGNANYGGFYAALKSDNAAFNVYADFCADTTDVTWSERKSIPQSTLVSFIAPDDCNFIYITIHGSQNLDQKPQSIKINGIEVTYNIRERIEEIGTGKKWVGLKWACVGDSLTEVNSKTTLHYHDYIKDETGITVVNMGVSGSGYKRHQDTNKAFFQRILNIPSDCDVVTIFGSGNDVANFPNDFGTATDTGTETVGGCINTTIDNLYSVIPAVQLGIVAPCPWDDYNPADTDNKMAEYVELLREICRNRSIPFLDLYHESNLRPWDSSFKAVAYTHDGGDGVHPDETGHKLLAGRFRAFVESLLGQY